MINQNRNAIVVVPGVGRKSFPLPTVEQLIEYCVNFINQSAAEKRAQMRAMAECAAQASVPDKTDGKEEGEEDWLKTDAAFDGDELKPEPQEPESESEEEFSPHGATLYAAAGGLAEIMYDGRFDQHLAPIFDPPTEIEAWAARSLPKKFQETVASLQYHWKELRKLFVGEHESSRVPVAGALPSVMHAVAANFPGASEDEVIEMAVRVICKALERIMSVLQIWDSSFVQLRDGHYNELAYLTYTLEECFRLFTAGAGVKTVAMKVGDVFMPRYSGNGPATIPGANGPLHAHLIEVPYAMRHSLIINMPAFTHEFRHDVFADIPGLPEQMAEAVARAIEEKRESFSFTDEMSWVGEQMVPTIELIKQIYIQTLSETDADICGGVLLTGPAYLYSIITLFSALNSMGESIFNSKELLRSSSVFRLNREDGLGLEPHMPDYARMFVVAAALDVLGFKEEAEDCRKLARQAVGEAEPRYISWRNRDRKQKEADFTIRVALKDLIQVAPVVADAIINARLACLGGRSNGELVYWDKSKQEKVEKLMRSLLRGKSELSCDLGSVHATYVAAAAVTAYWNLCKSGMQPRQAAARVEHASRTMLDLVQASNPETSVSE